MGDKYQNRFEFAVIVAIVVLIIAKFCGAFGHTL